jgi:hypothetical protein
VDPRAGLDDVEKRKFLPPAGLTNSQRKRNVCTEHYKPVNYFQLLTVMKVVTLHIPTTAECVGALSNFFTWPLKSLQLGQTSSYNKDINLVVSFFRATACGSGTSSSPPRHACMAVSNYPRGTCDSARITCAKVIGSRK